MPRTWNAVRPRQRTLTAVLPHQANTRILVPKRRQISDAPFAVLIFDDQFTDINGTFLTAHTPDLGTGWAATSSGPMIVQNNGAFAGGTNPGLEAPPFDYGNEIIGGIPSDFAARYSLGADAAATGSLVVPFWFRYSDDLNFWQAGWRISQNQFVIRKTVAGVSTDFLLQGGVQEGEDPTKNYVCVANGADIALFYDGVNKIQIADAFNQTATGAGVMARGSEGNPTVGFLEIFERG